MVVRRFGLPVRVLAGVVALVVSLGVLAGVPGLWPVPGAHATPVSTTDNPYVEPTKPVVPTAGAAVKVQQQVSASVEAGILLNSGMKPADVVSVTFLDNQTGASGSGVTSWNAGDPGNGSDTATADVKGWAKKNKDGKWDVSYGTNTQGKYPSFPVDSSGLFQGFNNLTAIKNLNKVNTSKVTDMSMMFQGCQQLSNLDVSHFDTSHVTDMRDMFLNCSQLSDLDVSHFDTSQVTDMEGMFSWCSGLSSVDVSHFDTSNVTDIQQMFLDCSQLRSVDVSHFDTSQVTDMHSMFRKCSGLTSLDLSSFDTSKVKPDEKNAFYRKDMLSGLSGLQSLQLGAQFTLKASEVGLGAPSQSVDKTGYTHDGKWHDAKTGVVKDPIPGAGSYTTFRPNTYKVHFDGNAPEGATVTGSVTDQSFTYDQALTALSANAYQCAGYTFVNWNKKQDGTDAGSYTDKAEVQNLTVKDADTVNLYAQWKANSYTVHFKAGADDATGSMNNQSFTYGVKQKLSANGFVRTGYAFAGWKVENGVSTLAADSSADTYEDEAEVQNLTAEQGGTVTLVAQWKANAYTVRFNGNAPEGAMVTGSMTDQSFTYDVKQPLSANAFVRTGYTFLNWSTQSDGVGDGSYADGEEVSNLTAKDKDTVNLYAQWTANSYTVRFDAGADGVTGSMADQKFTYDLPQQLSANGFVRTGYTFAGWKVKNSVSTLSADSRADTYEDKAEVSNLTADANGVVTLVAQWSKNAEPAKPSEPSTPSKPSNPSEPSTPSAPSTSSGSSASRSSVTSVGKREMSSLAATGVSGVPAVLVALVLAGVGVVIGMLRKRG